MCGTLTAEFNKNGKTMTRALNADKHYIAADGSKSTLRGRALLLVRNVGHLMTNPAILLSDGSEIPRGHFRCICFGCRSLARSFQQIEFTSWLDLCGQTKDAWARRSCIYR